MAITTVAGAISGLQPPVSFVKAAPGAGNLFKSYWGLAGFPGVGAYNGSLNGVTLSQTGGAITGAIPFGDPPSGSAYLGRCVMTSSGACRLQICDRLWHNRHS